MTNQRFHMKKIITSSLLLCLFPVFMNAEITRGSIITADNKIIAKSTKEEARVYPYKTTLEPALGYTNSKGTLGKTGIEKYEQQELSDGKDVYLNISLVIQEKIEKIIEKKKVAYDADEILVGVMNSKTGALLALASSNRFDPNNITEKDVSALNQKFAQYPYEPGSVLKPITLALALEHKVTTPDTWFNTFNGTMSMGDNHTITDDEKFESLTATGIIVHSSNVGISQISWRLTGEVFREGLMRFGFGSPSGIDLDRDLPGKLKSTDQLNNKLHRANTSYGYGIQATFTQLLKAYSMFNNDGISVTPHLIKNKVNTFRVISSQSTSQIHDILVEVVKRGTGVKAQYQGLEIGGKTGTAHMVHDGRYVREYHSSFYGFANDKIGNKYTIGVLVIRAKKKYKYFASQSAVPVFKEAVQILLDEKKLVVDSNVSTKSKIAR